MLTERINPDLSFLKQKTVLVFGLNGGVGSVNAEISANKEESETQFGLHAKAKVLLKKVVDFEAQSFWKTEPAQFKEFRSNNLISGNSSVLKKGDTQAIDPLSALFFLQNHLPLKDKKLTFAVLTKKGSVTVGLESLEEKTAWVEAFGTDRTLIHVKVVPEEKSDKIPSFFSEIERMQIWIDQESGLVAELGVKFGPFPFVSLGLKEVIS